MMQKTASHDGVTWSKPAKTTEGVALAWQPLTKSGGQTLSSKLAPVTANDLIETRAK